MTSPVRGISPTGSGSSVTDTPQNPVASYAKKRCFKSDSSNFSTPSLKKRKFIPEIPDEKAFEAKNTETPSTLPQMQTHPADYVPNQIRTATPPNKPVPNNAPPNYPGWESNKPTTPRN